MHFHDLVKDSWIVAQHFKVLNFIFEPKFLKKFWGCNSQSSRKALYHIHFMIEAEQSSSLWEGILPFDILWKSFNVNLKAAFAIYVLIILFNSL